MENMEDRVRRLERQVRDLGAREDIRQILSRYAQAVDEKRRNDLAEIFAPEAVLAVTPWDIVAEGREAILNFFDTYWDRFRNPRRYYTNESIILNSDGAEASMYWQLFQERSGESIVGWGTYRWEFRLEGTKWLITRQAVHILVMTRLDIGWATPDNVMPL